MTVNFIDINYEQQAPVVYIKRTKMNMQLAPNISIKEHIIHTLDNLDKTQLQQLVEYLSFLKFSARLKTIPSVEETKLATLYAEFADEDRKLAEEGMDEYTAGLLKEDTK